MGTRQRLAAFAQYASRATLKALRLPRPDVILGSSTPLTAAWAAAKTARLRNVPWVFEVRDIWPDFPIQMGAINNPWMQRRLYSMERKLYASAAHIIPLSPDMAAHIASFGHSTERITTLLNGTDLPLAQAVDHTDVYALRQQHGLGERHVILYAGTWGRANAIPALLRTAETLQHRQDLVFVFLGDGYYAEAVREAAQKYANVYVAPPQPRHRIFDWFSLASLSLVSFLNLPVLSANSPAKFFDSLAVGTPVLVTNPGWTRSFIEEHGCGWYAPASEPGALSNCIESIFEEPTELLRAGANGKAAAGTFFDRRAMADTLAQILYSSAQTPRERLLAV